MASPIVTNPGATLNGKKLALMQDFVIYRPEDYGAVGDGVTDDLAAIQACIAAAKVTGGTVLFGAKNYAFTGEIDVFQAGGRPVHLIGQGKRLDLQVASVAGTTLTFKSAVPGDWAIGLFGVNGMTMRGFNINCKGGVGVAGIGLYIGAAVGCTFEDIEVSASGNYAYRLEGTTSGVYRNTFKNLSSDSLCVSALLLISTNLAVSNVNVASNVFSQCNFYYLGTGGAFGINLASADNNAFIDLTINCVDGAIAGEAIILGVPSAAQFGAGFNVFVNLDGGTTAGIQRGVKADSTLPNVCYGIDFANGLVTATTSTHSEKFFRNDTTGILNTRALQFIEGIPFGASVVPFQMYYDTSALKVRFQSHDAATLRGFIFSGAIGAGAESVLFEIDGSGKIYERGRSVASGDFVYPAWVLGNFSSSGGGAGLGWTTVAGTTKFGISRRGTTALAKFNITGSTVVNAGNLQMSLVPFGLVVSAAMNFTNTCRIVDNGGAAVAGLVSAIASDNKIIIQLMAGTGFAASAANTAASGEIQFETTT